ncbi:MAG TPA: SRPBCC domain-containing protein [Allosphingosinicella sp.]|nr:SRPBCC domain-containing protein [Allosphingosinicella sp.]
MIRIVTEALLPHPRERVWAVLTDFARYPEWNPLVLEAEGEPAAGARLRLLIARPDGSGRHDRLSARIVELERGARLAWRGSIPLLFTGRHWFALADAPSGTLFRHGEDMSGLFPLIGGARMAARYRPGYDRFNAALAARLAAAAAA